MSTCRSCGGEIIWARTAAGKSMPLDPEPSQDGNVEAVRDGHGTLSVVTVHKEHPMFAGDLFMPHFATCPTWGSDG